MRFRSFLETFHYIGQCDRLRMQSDENQQNWHEMMAQRRPVSQEEFLKNVDMSPLLDEEDTAESYLSGFTNVAFYRSIWGGRPAYFFESRGFEFIFVQ